MTSPYEHLFTPIEREASLPMWARKLVEQLRMRLQEADRKLTPVTDPQTARIVIDPNSDHPTYVEHDEEVVFRFQDDTRISGQIQTTRTGEQFLVIYGTGGARTSLVIRPIVSNSIRLRIEE